MCKLILKQQEICYRATQRHALTYTVQGGLIAIKMVLYGYVLVGYCGQGLVSAGDFALIFGLAVQTFLFSCSY